MTDRQIQELLLTHYLFAIEMVKEEGFRKALPILSHMQADCGVCWCADCLTEQKTKFMFFPPKWIKKHLRVGENYWGPKPIVASNKSQILSRLKLRVDILNKEIQLSK